MIAPRLLTSGLLLTTLILVSGCRHLLPSQRPRDDFGSLVIATRAAGEFGLVSGDTLVEVHADDVPTAVLSASSEFASRRRYDARCSRYFHKDAQFVVLFSVGCIQGEVWEDGQGLAAYRRDGLQVGTAIPYVSAEDYSAVVPTVRYLHEMP